MFQAKNDMYPVIVSDIFLLWSGNHNILLREQSKNVEKQIQRIENKIFFKNFSFLKFNSKYLLSNFLWFSSLSARMYVLQFNFVMYLCILSTKISIVIEFLSLYCKIIAKPPKSALNILQIKNKIKSKCKVCMKVRKRKSK